MSDTHVFSTKILSRPSELKRTDDEEVQQASGAVELRRDGKPVAHAVVVVRKTAKGTPELSIGVGPATSTGFDGYKELTFDGDLALALGKLLSAASDLLSRDFVAAGEDSAGGTTFTIRLDGDSD